VTTDYSRREHEFSPSDFEPSRIHSIEDEAARYSDDMTPALALWNPKYPHNVAAAVRAASCFGAKAVLFSGSRVPIAGSRRYRLPREERMRGYSEVVILNDDRFFGRFGGKVTPVAVEFRDQAEPLTTFSHPPRPLYVFGPEDGSIPQVVLRHCHRFVCIPSIHCLNLGSAVSVVLYDRIAKLGVVVRDDLKALAADGEALDGAWQPVVIEP